MPESSTVKGRAHTASGPPAPGEDMVPPFVTRIASKDLQQHGEASQTKGRMERVLSWQHWGVMLHFSLWLLITSWWVAGLALHNSDKNWLLPFLLWLSISVRLVTLYVSTSYVTRPLGKAWAWTTDRTASRIPGRLQIPIGAAVACATVLVGTYATPWTPDNTYGHRSLSLAGFATAVLGLWATSRHRSHINWRAVVVGILMQFLLGIFVMRSQTGRDIFEFIAHACKTFLGFSQFGLKFLLTGSDEFVDESIWFLLSVAPPIIFFVATVSMLAYWGWTQWLVRKFAAFFFYTMRVSGAESVVAAASPFLGLGESAMLVRPYLARLTPAELHQVMASGLATIAGSVLYAFISLGVSGKVVLSSCVMSIPAAFVASKLRYPEMGEPATAGRVEVADDVLGKEGELEGGGDGRPRNALQALSDGTWLGLKVAGMVCAVVLVLISLVAFINSILNWAGSYLNVEGLNLAQIMGYPLYPVAVLCGVSPEGRDAIKVAELIGTKIVVNEFAAYVDLVSEPYSSVLTARSRLIAMYALCGFGNIGSVGIAVGVLSQLAPETRGRVASVAVSALITGIIATLTSACIAGMLVTDAEAFLKTSA